jgi:hypothetical protein
MNLSVLGCRFAALHDEEAEGPATKAVLARSRLHHRRHVRGDRARQPLEILAAFQHRDDALMAVAAGDLHELLCRPGEVGFDKVVEIDERTAPVRVEAGRSTRTASRKEQRFRFPGTCRFETVTP